MCRGLSCTREASGGYVGAGLMTLNRDIQVTAPLVIKQHGENAGYYAARRIVGGQVLFGVAR